jgi:hypothetical protein
MILQQLQTAVGLLLCVAASLALLAYAWVTFWEEMERVEIKHYVGFLRMIEVPDARLDIEEFRCFLLSRFDREGGAVETLDQFWGRLDEHLPHDRMAERLFLERQRYAELNAANISLRDLIGRVVDEISQLPAGDARFQSIYGKLRGAVAP